MCRVNPRRGAPSQWRAVDVVTVYHGPFDDFVARRTALVRELRSSDPDGAAAAGKLRKPPVTVWAIDQLAAERPAVVAEVLAAGADAARAQRAATAEAGSGEDLLAAAGRLRAGIEVAVRAATRVLDAAGHGTGEDAIRRIRTTMQAAAGGSAEERLAVWRGTLDRDLAPTGFGSLGGEVDDVPELARALASLRRPTSRLPAAARKGARAQPGADDRARRAAEREAANQAVEAQRARATATTRRQEAQRLAKQARAADESATTAEDAAAVAEDAARRAHLALG